MHRIGAESSNVVPTSPLCTNIKSTNLSAPSSNNMGVPQGPLLNPSPISEAIINASKPIINTNKIITSSSPLHNNKVAAPIISSPKRKELGPSIRPVVNNKDIINNITSPTGPGLIHSRSGSNLLARNTYDCKIAGLYDLEETLGRGHFAVVKLARHVFTGEKVAVKVIDKTKLDEVSRAHLFQEVRCMKLVQHPNVVRLYEVIDTQTKLYLILELADGGDLYDYIMRHDEGLGEDQARNYFRQIVHAISYCHKLHVVHRDLKPENVVFFERLGMVKLTDFGFSNRFNPGQKLETSCGSLAYSAPEILLGDSYDAPAVDVWSLGVILYMLVCGHAPFQEANDSETLTMIMDCKYSIPAYISPACKKLISRMLVREPERRATLEELATDPWLVEGSGVMPAEYLPLISREHVSEEDHAHILQKMVNGKIATKEEILDALDKNEYNHITATYFLLAERKLRAHRQEQAQKAAGGVNTTLATSPAAQTLGASSPSPILLSPGSPGDLILAKPVLLPSAAPRLPSLSSQPSTLLTVPTESAQAVARGRKCSIVTEEEDDEDNEDSGRDSSSHGSCRSLLNRRGSRSEGKLSLALQERLAEARKEPRPVTAAPVAPKPCPRYHKAPVIARINSQITAAATVSIPIVIQTNASTSPSRFKTLPAPSRPLHSVVSSPQLTLNEIFEEGVEESKKSPTTNNVAAVVPRVVVTRQKFHKNRTASCSSSDASDEDSESRKKRAHKLKTLPGNSRRRDSHDDSSDSQGGQGGSGNGGGDSGSPENTSVTHSSEKQHQSSSTSNGGSNSGRRHTGFRRRCGTAGETRLRESQSLNRITEVQESSESLTQTLTNNAITQATSPRSRRSFGARFLLLVGGGGSGHSKKSHDNNVETKENCTTSKTKITRYFHLHRKLCLPMFKQNHNSTNNNNNNPSTTNDVWLGASKPV